MQRERAIVTDRKDCARRRKPIYKIEIERERIMPEDWWSSKKQEEIGERQRQFYARHE
jgi:hypothetical protein